MARLKWLSSLIQHDDAKPPFMLKFRSSQGFIVTTISLAVFTDMFLYGVIVPVIPFALRSRSHVDWSRVQYWVSVLVAIYGASLLAFSPICGWLADRGSSRRTPFILGLLSLSCSTVLLNVGNSVGMLISGRILQGASAAIVWVVGLALLADTVPHDQFAQSTGWVSLGMSLGITVSPLLGGIVFDHAGYNAVFGMTYALIGLDIVLRLLLIEKKVAVQWLPVISSSEATEKDERSEVAAAAEQSFDTEKATPSPTVADEAAAQHRRRRDRLPPVVSLLLSRRLLAVLFCTLVQAALLTSFDSVLTIRAANIFGWMSTGAGLLFLAIVLPGFLAPLFGWLSDTYGGRYFVSGGFLLACPPLICLRLVDTNNIQNKVLLCALLALTGLFIAVTFPGTMAAISSIVEGKERKMVEQGQPGFGPGGAYAQAYALYNVAFAAGCMVGPLLAGFIVEKEGWATMSSCLGAIAAVTAVPGWFSQKR